MNSLQKTIKSLSVVISETTLQLLNDTSVVDCVAMPLLPLFVNDASPTSCLLNQAVLALLLVLCGNVIGRGTRLTLQNGTPKRSIHHTIKTATEHMEDTLEEERRKYAGERRNHAGKHRKHAGSMQRNAEIT